MIEMILVSIRDTSEKDMEWNANKVINAVRVGDSYHNAWDNRHREYLTIFESYETKVLRKRDDRLCSN